MIQVSSTNSVHEFPWLRQIQVRNSLGIPYVLFQDGFKIGLYKGNAIHPTSFSIVDNSHASTLTSISSCAIDSNDIIHILVANGHELEYITFNAMTDTYLSTETISFDPTIIPSHVSYNEYTLGAPYIAVDSNDVPHILFLGQENLWGGPAGAQFYYNNRIGGSWKSANILVSDTNFNNWTTTTFIVDGDDLPIIGTSIYIDGSSGSGYLYIGNANNATVFAQQSLGIVGRDGISIAVDKSGNHVIGLIDHATFKPGFRIHTRASAWDSWSAIITVPDILPYHTSSLSE